MTYYPNHFSTLFLRVFLFLSSIFGFFKILFLEPGLGIFARSGIPIHFIIFYNFLTFIIIITQIAINNHVLKKYRIENIMFNLV